jgi:hypothetical protein
VKKIFMKLKLYKLVLLCCFLHLKTFAGYVPLTVSTGFNADVIAEGTGAANTLTTAAVDDNSFVFVVLGWKLTASSTGLTYGLPTNGTINSTINTGLQFQLAAYNVNNVLRINTTNAAQTVSFAAPYKNAAVFYFTATGGSGACTVSATVNFSDGTSQTQTGIAINDWFGGTPFILGGIGRLGYTSSVPENPSGGPRLYQYSVSINATNQAKLVTSVTITRTAGSGIANVFAFAVKEPMVYSTAPVSNGFNADVIVDGEGNTQTRTTNDVDGVSYCFIAQGWKYNSTSTPYTGGLPSSGIVNSLIDPGLTYQLAPYDANNCLRIATNNAPATVTFQTPFTAENIHVLNTTGSGSAVMSATVNFSDGTTQTFSNMATNDWYGATPYEIGQIGRVLRNTTSTNANIESSTTGPRLYRNTLSLSAANYNKTITSIAFTRNSISGTDTKLCIFAISSEKALVQVCTAPTALTATAITATSASLDWTASGSSALWQIKYGPAGFNVNNSGTTIMTTTKPYVLNPPLTPSTGYDYYVRTVCSAGDTSSWSTLSNFTTLCQSPTIASRKDSFVCGTGTAILEASASSGTIKWYNAATGGSALFTGNLFNTPSISTTTTYYVAAVSASGCESARLPVIATSRSLPIVNLGNDTTLCPNATINLNATNSNPSASYLWNNNSANATLNATAIGTYFVKVTVNKCAATDTIHITAGIVPTNALPDSADLCEDASIVLDAHNMGSTYVWSGTNNTTQTETITTPGLVSVAIKSIDGCITTSTCTVVDRPLPIKPFHNGDTTICKNDAITLDALNPNHSYLWNTGALTQTITQSDSGKTSVTITSVYGCVTRDTIYIAYAPAPVSDGFNFILQFNEDIGKVKFEVINPINVTHVMWNFGDGTNSTTYIPTHQYAAEGDYNVVLTVYNDCGSDTYEQVIRVLFHDPNAIDDITKTNEAVSLYPNPAQNKVNIAFQETKHTLYSYTLSNVLGQNILKGNNINSSNMTIHVENLPAGIYQISLNTSLGLINKKLQILK